MKKIKTIICLAMICVLFGACAPKRQADKQLKDVPYLHAAKMQILDEVTGGGAQEAVDFQV